MNEHPGYQIEDILLEKTRLYTHRFWEYTGLGEERYKHYAVNNVLVFGFGYFASYHIEGFWGVLR